MINVLRHLLLSLRSLVLALSSSVAAPTVSARVATVAVKAAAFLCAARASTRDAGARWSSSSASLATSAAVAATTATERQYVLDWASTELPQHARVDRLDGATVVLNFDLSSRRQASKAVVSRLARCAAFLEHLLALRAKLREGDQPTKECVAVLEKCAVRVHRGDEAGLFLQLADRGLQRCLAWIDVATWQHPALLGTFLRRRLEHHEDALLNRVWTGVADDGKRRAATAAAATTTRTANVANLKERRLK